jgi:hypothetical protein
MIWCGLAIPPRFIFECESPTCTNRPTSDKACPITDTITV